VRPGITGWSRLPSAPGGRLTLPAVPPPTTASQSSPHVHVRPRRAPAPGPRGGRRSLSRGVVGRRSDGFSLRPAPFPRPLPDNPVSRSAVAQPLTRSHRQALCDSPSPGPSQSLGPAGPIAGGTPRSAGPFAELVTFSRRVQLLRQKGSRLTPTSWTTLAVTTWLRRELGFTRYPRNTRAPPVSSELGKAIRCAADVSRETSARGRVTPRRGFIEIASVASHRGQAHEAFPPALE
jgi:hypothetical protein